MKYLFIGLILGSILLFNNSCNDDDNEPDLCTENIIVNESFVGKKGCEYTYITSDGDTIKVNIFDIADNRDYGTDCQVSTGGYAEVSISAAVNNRQRLKTFTWRGCDGFGEHDPDMETLPKLQLDKGYVLKMMKMYPLSETQENPPSSKEEYGIRLIIMK